MNNTIYATFANPSMAERAAGALLDHGVRSEHLSIVFPEGYRSLDGNDKTTGDSLQNSAEKGISTTTGADAASGATKGAGIGLAAGALAALAAVFLPGIGLVIGGGALAIALGGVAGTTVAGALAGGVTGYLKDQGVSEADIQTYTTVLGKGGALMTVATSDEKIDATTIQALITKYDGTYSNTVATSMNTAVVDTSPTGTPVIR